MVVVLKLPIEQHKIIRLVHSSLLYGRPACTAKCCHRYTLNPFLCISDSTVLLSM